MARGRPSTPRQAPAQARNLRQARRPARQSGLRASSWMPCAPLREAAQGYCRGGQGHHLAVRTPAAPQSEKCRLASARHSIWERHHAPHSLGPRDVEQRDEDDLDAGGTEAPLRADRRRRLVRQDRHAGISRDEPDGSGAHPAGRRLHAVGEQRDLPLPVPRPCAAFHHVAAGPARARQRRPLDGRAADAAEPADRRSVLGAGPHPARQARHGGDQAGHRRMPRASGAWCRRSWRSIPTSPATI